MITTLGIVHVPCGLEDAEFKLGRKLGGKPLLEWVVRRVTDCQRLDSVIVVFDDVRQRERIAPLVPPDVPTFVGDKRDPLARFVAAVEHYGAKTAVRIPADNPFVDPVLIDRLVSTADAHPSCDYISYCFADGRPALLSHVGVFAEWCSAAALARANREATRPTDRDHVTSYLYAHPELFKVRLIPLPPELDRHDLRLSIDCHEDWEHAQAIYDALGPDEWDWRRIADLLDNQPAARPGTSVLDRAD